MALITLNNKSIIIESATYDGKIYEGSELVALIDKLKVHLNAISGDIDLSAREFTVYRDRVESNGKSRIIHQTEYNEIVEKTKNFTSLPGSPLSKAGVNPDLLIEKRAPLAESQTMSDLKEEIGILNDKIDDLFYRLGPQNANKKTKADLDDELNPLEEENRELKATLSSLDIIFREDQEKIDSLQEMLSHYDKQMQASKVYLNGNNRMIEQLGIAVEELQLKLGMKDTFIKVLEKENDHLKKDIAHQAARYDALTNQWKAAIEAQMETIAQLNTKLGNFEEEVIRLEKDAVEKEIAHEQILLALRNGKAVRTQ